MEGAFKRLKLKGPGIIVCNHNHWIEAPLITFTMPLRNICSVISDVVVSNKISRWFLNAIDTVIINKEKFELENFKKIINLLKNGQLILIFPEGAMNGTKEIAPLKTGVATISYLANVPIYPIYIHPHHKPFHPQHIILGKKIVLYDHFKELNTITSSEMTKMLYDYLNLMKDTLESEINN